jgi:glycosyltransferase involved in cell wall biosynthesis
MKLISFIVPVYNEEHTIEEVLGKLGKIELGLKKEIIVINDGSTDGTVKIVQAMQKKYDQIKLFAHETNLGKGSALNTGFKYSSGDIIAIQDADLEYNIEDFKKLIQPIILNKFKVVYGSRWI